MKNYIIIVAGGSGSRMKSDIPKQFMLLKGKPILMHTIEVFLRFDDAFSIILALPKHQIDYWKKLCKENNFELEHQIAEGGKTRYHSVKNALSKIDDANLVAVHDGVRPFVSNETIKRCFEGAQEFGNAIPVCEVTESLRKINRDTSKSVDRSEYKLVQTPQVFQFDLLKKAYNSDYITLFTDDASVFEYSGHEIHLESGNSENIKITSPHDLIIAEAFCKLKVNNLFVPNI